MQTATVKAFKGRGMEGRTAKWYANMTLKTMDDFRVLARRVADKLPDGGRVLEVAPGPGYFAIELAKLGGYQVTGLDISHTFVDIARNGASRAGVEVDFRQGNAAAMPFEDARFDFIVCRAAFKNFAEPVRALQEMHRVLAPGGRAMIIDLRRDASIGSINQATDAMHLGMVNSVITKLTFRFMLLKRAYTRREIQNMVAQTSFGTAKIKEELIGLEVCMRKPA